MRLAKMQAAADRGGSSMKMSGLPGVPARESLGDLLLELNRRRKRSQRSAQYLKRHPTVSTLYGTAQAAHLAGNAAAAKRYLEQLKQLCGVQADRAKLVQAKEAELGR